jgi:hypothetical protein
MMIAAAIEQYAVNTNDPSPVQPKLVVAWWFKEYNGFPTDEPPVPFTVNGSLNPESTIVGLRYENVKEQAERFIARREAAA